MDRHTVFGDSQGEPPLDIYTYAQAPKEKIMVGNYFYAYGAMAAGWHCSGARVWVTGAADTAWKELEISVWRTHDTPVDISTAPLASVTSYSDGWSGRWVEVTWPTPLTMSAGDLFFIGYRFLEEDVNHIYFSSGPTDIGAASIRSVDDVDLVLAEDEISKLFGSTMRGQYRVGNGPTETWYSWYGTDIIVTPDERSGKVKHWNGSEWTAHPVKRWDGMQWHVHNVGGYADDGYRRGKA